MKIPLGGGAYIEPDEGNRNSRFHMRILATKRIPNTLVGHFAQLECGHIVQMYGNLELTGGVALCTACRDAWAAKMN